MITPEHLKVIVEDVQKFYGGNDCAINIRPKHESLNQKDERNAEREKAIEGLRYELAGGEIPLSHVEYGAALHSAEVRYGCCSEMACYAAYVAWNVLDCEKKRGGNHNIFVAYCNTTNHLFCVLGEAKWKKKELDVSSGGNSFVIDPWAKIYCLVAKYRALLDNRVAEWTMGRLLVDGKEPEFWKKSMYCATVDMVTACSHYQVADGKF